MQCQQIFLEWKFGKVELFYSVNANLLIGKTMLWWH